MIFKYWYIDNQFFIKDVNSEDTYTNPVRQSNHPDPGALPIPKEHGGGFIVVSTSNYETNSKSGPVFPILWSKDLVNWTKVMIIEVHSFSIFQQNITITVFLFF